MWGMFCLSGSATEDVTRVPSSSTCYFQWPWVIFRSIYLLLPFQVQFLIQLCSSRHDFKWHRALHRLSATAWPHDNLCNTGLDKPAMRPPQISTNTWYVFCSKLGLFYTSLDTGVSIHVRTRHQPGAISQACSRPRCVSFRMLSITACPWQHANYYAVAFISFLLIPLRR